MSEVTSTEVTQVRDHMDDGTFTDRPAAAGEKHAITDRDFLVVPGVEGPPPADPEPTLEPQPEDA